MGKSRLSVTRRAPTAYATIRAKAKGSIVTEDWLRQRGFDTQRADASSMDKVSQIGAGKRLSFGYAGPEPGNDDAVTRRRGDLPVERAFRATVGSTLDDATRVDGAPSLATGQLWLQRTRWVSVTRIRRLVASGAVRHLLGRLGQPA